MKTRLIIVLLFCLSGRTVLAAETEPIDQFNHFLDLFKTDFEAGSNESVHYLDSCFVVLPDIKEEYYHSQAYFAKSRYNTVLAELDSAQYYLDRAEETAEPYKDSLLYVRLKYYRTELYMLEGKYLRCVLQIKKTIKAIEENFEVYFITRGEEINLLQAKCLMKLGSVYGWLGAYEKALNAYLESLEACSATSSKAIQRHEAFLNGNIGLVYFHLDEMNNAESYTLKSIEQKEKLGLEKLTGFNNRVLGMISYENKEYKDALSFLDISDEKYEAEDNILDVERNQYWRSKCLIELGENKKAQKLLIELVDTNFSHYQDADLIGVYELLGISYKKEGRYEDAANYWQIAYEKSGELKREFDQKLVDEFLNFYENEQGHFEEKLEFIRNKQEKEKMAIEMALEGEKRRWVILFFSVITLFLVSIIFIISKAYRKNKVTNTMLVETVEQKEILFKEVHHRVKNNFQVMSSLLNLQSGLEGDERSKLVLESARNRIQSMSLVHEMLYSFDQIKEINFEVYCKELVSGIIKTFEQEKKITFTIDCIPYPVDLNKAVPLGLILNESITNSIKYAFGEMDEGHIAVLLSKNKGKLLLIIKDNGIGLSENSDSDSGGTLGLELIHILGEQLGGTVSIRNNKGAEIRIEFDR